ncbi:pyridoxal phosphate-dependent aminotransferase [Sinorhizobium meliloti]|uniref:pyridoxal phosphate-dependent aminotransferase n=1 Tax=Rhizobium meliloti TaxID=382 RepID=UPI000FD96F8E|nr:histidinol-phosphate transaminase [Sinorhizobium meliloti]RVM17887.1 histidinol-phosphate aminotransferase family protein [Sinorhizobium meliloti]RVO34203.1 histidinol-phosphate aminotransferase family protein [Sinorhizobium meliloti]
MQSKRFSQSVVDQLIDGLPGGYWKYPITEHVLTYNTFFPPEAILEEIRNNIRNLVANYPSPPDILVQQLAILVGAPPAQLVLGNGTVGLINNLIRGRQLRIAVAVPSFAVYENAAKPDRLVTIELTPPAFDIDPERILAAVRSDRLDAVVLISPSNPTSRAVPRARLLYLARQLRQLGAKLIVDESFIEFVRRPGCETLSNDLEDHPNIVIVKSLGKIFGICGARLGYLQSADTELVWELRAAEPIWGINAISEYFLANLPRFQTEFEKSVDAVCASRDALFDNLRSIVGATALPPDGNYVFFRLPDQWPDADVVARDILSEHKILLRHCGGKTMAGGLRYFRISARSETENGALVEALREIGARYQSEPATMTAS